MYGGPKKKECVSCGKSFDSHNIVQIHCSPECRFDEYAIPEPMSGCWLWLGNKNAQGYGVIDLRNKLSATGSRIVSMAHRYSYERFKGTIPNGLCVMHSCDNPSCVNPRHLSVGTWHDNIQDYKSKGRRVYRVYTDEDRKRHSSFVIGSKNASAKITEEIALQIYNTEGTYRGLAKEFNINRTTIRRIKNKTAWKHIHEQAA